jgi:ferredoxin
MPNQADPVDLEIIQEDGAPSRLKKVASPVMRTEVCVNCGACLRACPTGAVHELQRQICGCADCAAGSSCFRGHGGVTAESWPGACPIGHYPEGYVHQGADGNS